jgi:transcription termination/antitermination protein NusG
MDMSDEPRQDMESMPNGEPSPVAPEPAVPMEVMGVSDEPQHGSGAEESGEEPGLAEAAEATDAELEEPAMDLPEASEEKEEAAEAALDEAEVLTSDPEEPAMDLPEAIEVMDEAAEAALDEAERLTSDPEEPDSDIELEVDVVEEQVLPAEIAEEQVEAGDVEEESTIEIDYESPSYDLDEEAGEDLAAEAEEWDESGESETGLEAQAAAEPVPDDDRLWYVIHCYSGQENKVRHNLEQRIDSMGMKDRIFDVVVPTEEEIEVKDGKRRTVERRVFPGYILVQMILSEESWYVVRNTPGVTGFVGMGNEPTPLRPEEVSQIIKRMEAEAPRIKVTYKIGQKVRIIDGPFNDFIGTVDDIDMERAKVRVMVSFFGRETPVELDFLQVEKA